MLWRPVASLERLAMESVRWVFSYASWGPCREDWLLAMRLVQPEEKERIGQFVFARDAKAAMAGRLLIRKLIAEKLNIPWNEIQLGRTSKGKPILVNDLSSSRSPFNFNISHQGNYAVLAAEPDRQVGIDIMKTSLPEVGRKEVTFILDEGLLFSAVCPGNTIPISDINFKYTISLKTHHSLHETPSESLFEFERSFDFVKLGGGLSRETMFALRGLSFSKGSGSIPDFFRIMNRQFTEEEWRTITSVRNEWLQLDMFHRHWALKESFIKAIGVGIGFDLRRIEFNVSPAQLEVGRTYNETIMLLDGEEEKDWTFEETRLDNCHHVAVALGKPEGFKQKHTEGPCRDVTQTAFTTLSFDDLVASAVPLTPEDPACWDNFCSRQNSPARQSSNSR